MTRDYILNRISIEKHGIYFNQILSINERAEILQQALDEVLNKKNPSDSEIEERVWEEITIPLCDSDRILHTDNYIYYLNAVNWVKFGINYIDDVELEPNQNNAKTKIDAIQH